MNEHRSDALVAPAVARNRDPILAVLSRVLPSEGTVLEIASGSGEHAAYFAAGLPNLVWQPTDVDPVALKSVSAHRDLGALPNLLSPLELDVEATSWPITCAAAVVCINMLHIAPWSAAEGLMAGAGRVLPPAGVLYLYGPFQENGQHTAPSNAALMRACVRAIPIGECVMSATLPNWRQAKGLTSSIRLPCRRTILVWCSDGPRVEPGPELSSCGSAEHAGCSP